MPTNVGTETAKLYIGDILIGGSSNFGIQLGDDEKLQASSSRSSFTNVGGDHMYWHKTNGKPAICIRNTYSKNVYRSVSMINLYA